MSPHEARVAERSPEEIEQEAARSGSLSRVCARDLPNSIAGRKCRLKKSSVSCRHGSRQLPRNLRPLAIQDLEDAVTFIAANDARAAERLGNALIDQARILTTFPELGRTVPEFPTWLSRNRLSSVPHHLSCRPERKLMEIARFWHAARGLPEV